MGDIVHLGAFVFAQVVDQFVDCLQQRIERILVAVHQHPGGKRAAALFVKGIEGKIDHFARATLTRPGCQHRVFDRRADRNSEMPREFLLQARSRAEMVQQIGVGSPNSRGNGLQRDRLRAQLNQQRPCRLKRDGTALFLRETFPY